MTWAHPSVMLRIKCSLICNRQEKRWIDYHVRELYDKSVFQAAFKKEREQSSTPGQELGAWPFIRFSSSEIAANKCKGTREIFKQRQRWTRAMDWCRTPHGIWSCSPNEDVGLLTSTGPRGVMCAAWGWFRSLLQQQRGCGDGGWVRVGYWGRARVF